MKKLTKCLIISLMFTLSTVLLSACSLFAETKQLSSPDVISVETIGNTCILTITPIDNAYSYIYSIDGALRSSVYNYIDISNLLSQYKDYDIFAMAIAGDDNKEYTNSDWGKSYTYSVTGVLDAPVVAMNNYMISWGSVTNASEYNISYTTPNNTYTKSTTNTYFDFTDIIDSVGIYTFSVQAISKTTNIENSVLSNTVIYKQTDILEKPSGLSVMELDSDIILYFNSDSRAESHILYINNLTFNITDNEVNLSELDDGNIVSQVGKYEISIKSNIISDYILNSEISDVIIYEKYEILSTPIVTLIRDNNNDILVSVITNDANSKYLDVYVYDFDRSDFVLLSQYMIADEIKISSDYLNNSQLVVKVISVGYGYYKSSLECVASYTELTALSSVDNIDIQDGILTFDPVDFADKYLVSIDNISYTIEENYLDISEILTQAKQYLIYIKAIDSTYSYMDSENSIFYYINYQKLDTVIITEIEESKSGYLLKFEYVDNAVYYDLYVDGEKVASITNNSYNLLTHFTANGEYTIEVLAVSVENSYYLDSDKSEAVVINHIVQLADISNITINIDDLNLSFDKVEYAINYKITVDTNTFYTVENENIDLTEYITQAKQYTITIQALSDDDEFIIDGEIAIYEFKNYVQFETITDLEIVGEDGVYELSFTAVENAESYTVYIQYSESVNIIEKIININILDISEYLQQAGDYLITVKVNETGYFIESEISEAYEMNIKLTLESPTVTSITKNMNNEEIFVVIEVTNLADGIEVYVDDELLIDINNYSDYIVSIGVDTTTYKFNIGQLIYDEDTYVISVRALGSENYFNSLYTSESYEYTRETMYDYQRGEVFMYGNYFDNYIDSYDELTLLVWHTYLYDSEQNIETSRDFYMTSNSLSIVIEEYNIANPSYIVDGYLYLIYYILNFYPENIHFINFTVTQSGNIYTFKYTSTLTTDHTEYMDYEEEYKNMTSSEKYSYDTSSYNIDLTQYESLISPYLSETDRNRTDSWDNFAIVSDGSRTEEVEVYTTEQLLMVVQYGAIPIITDTTSVVYTVYENAKQVLREIINNNYSQYEKVEAIYNWLIYTNFYNYKSMAWSEAVSDSSVESLGSYADYYMEGVLYDLDNSSAVCDGITKAFALLCGLEGIDCTKISGYANGGNHAWNKVKVAGVWYIVDATWSDLTINYYGTYYSLPSHFYFLKSESEMSTHVEYWPNDSSQNCTTSYDYYANYSYDNTDNTLVIYNLEQLIAALDYAGSNWIILRFDPSYWSAAANIENSDELEKILASTGKMFNYIQFTGEFAQYIGFTIFPVIEDVE